MTDDENPYLSPQAGREKRPTGEEVPEPNASRLVFDANQVQLISYEQAVEANLCQSVLRSHGIDSWLENELATVNFLISSAVGGVKVFVRASDLTRASELLAEARAAMLARRKQDSITFNCEECDALITFPGARRGHVETCPKCREYIDVPD
jgi:hypothetical protein